MKSFVYVQCSAIGHHFITSRTVRVVFVFSSVHLCVWMSVCPHYLLNCYRYHHRIFTASTNGSKGPTSSKMANGYIVVHGW